jgi:L-ribulose-5-phosphate 4-epimerase
VLDELRIAVCQANLALAASGLAIDTWGNASGIDRDSGCMVIKPSGLAYDQMQPADMVVISLDDGRVVEGHLRASSDTATHLEIYRALPGIGGVVHTHSLYATAWAQAEREIPALGTTHADFFHGPVPCTRLLTADEITGDYEANTGKVIVERLAKMDIAAAPAVLVAGHGPFAWGATPEQAVRHAVVLEQLARLASETLRLSPDQKPISQVLLDKHFQRKHGPRSYYGQP